MPIQTKLSAYMLTHIAKGALVDTPWPEICKLQTHLEPVPFETLSSGWHLLSSYFQSVLICLSLLSCISTAAEPTFARKFRDQLQDEKTQMSVDKVLGCEKRVLKHILDIAELQHWKESSAIERPISMVQLVKRAIPIEKELQESHLWASDSSNGPIRSNLLARQESAITKTMVCAAGGESTLS